MGCNRKRNRHRYHEHSLDTTSNRKRGGPGSSKNSWRAFIHRADQAYNRSTGPKEFAMTPKEKIARLQDEIDSLTASIDESNDYLVMFCLNMKSFDQCDKHGNRHDDLQRCKHCPRHLWIGDEHERGPIQQHLSEKFPSTRDIRIQGSGPFSPRHPRYIHFGWDLGRKQGSTVRWSEQDKQYIVEDD